jgi:putative oxidoreductase
MAFAGGLSVAVGYKTKWGAWTLVAFLVPVTFCRHAFWKLHDPSAVHVQQAMFAKNLCMIGAALLISQFGGGRVSLDEPRPMENDLRRQTLSKAMEGGGQ